MKAGEIMNKVMVIDENVKLKDAARIMAEKRIGCLVVMTKDKIVGVLSESDIVKYVKKLNSKVSLVMSKDVLTVDVSEDIDNVARIMSENKIRRLPVMNRGQLVGIITTTDLIANADALNESFIFE